ncbi:MAG TPA: hypothetical protein VKT78_00420 [Fimbriimonadaceae bacterium]|nr:hypothetical protein [Fimbriimonadaceae bacterium]
MTTLAFVLLAGAGIQSPPAAIDTDLAARYFRQAERLSDVDGGRLWGVRLYGPMLFADSRTRSVVGNQPDKEGRLKRAGSVWVGTLGEADTVANTATQWAGVRWTMVMWPLPKLERPRGRLMMHECYHRIQDGLGLPGKDASMPHLDSREGRTWLRLEMRSLAVAVDGRGEERARAAEDAIVFRRERRAKCGPDAAGSEQRLEINEGLAEYTGFRLSGYPEADLDDRAAVGLESLEGSSSLGRSFAYDTGPAYGRLLDGYAPGWRKKLTAVSDLGETLAAAIHLQVTGDLDALANERSKVYEGDVVMAEEARLEARRLTTIKNYTARFIDGKALCLTASANFTYSYDPYGVDSLPNWGTVYPNGKFTDDWGVLTVTDGGALVVRKNGPATEVRVTAPGSPDGSTIKGEGWELTLNPGWKLVSGLRAGDWQAVKG